MIRTDLTKVDVRLAVSDSPVALLPVKIRCREADHRGKDRENSMAVYADGIKCFGCGFQVKRRMEALSYLLFGSTDRWREAIRVSDQYTDEALDAYRKKAAQEARRDPLPKSLASAYNRYLYTRHASMGWLGDRRISPETVKRFCLGHTGTAYTIPVYDQDERLIAIRYRRDDLYEVSREEGEKKRPKYSGTSGRNGTYTYPDWLIARKQPDTLYMLEGELDVVLMWQLGYPAITLTNGAGQLKNLPRLIKEGFPSARHLVMVGDQDEPGRAAAEETIQAAKEEGFTVESISWSLELGKDIGELTKNGYDLKGMNRCLK